jgi:hypothetical protein
MAVFLERGMRGRFFAPPPASGTVFADVGAGDFAASFIEQLAADGITSGCGNGNYCPIDTVTRAQMVVFLLRAKYGSDYTPPPAAGNVFGDVGGSFAAAWIEQAAAEGITAGCGSGNFCPNDPVTRAQMAVFLVRTFNLSFPNDAPTVVAFAPANNATDVPVDQAVLVTFSEAINPDTFVPPNVTVTGPGGNPIAGTFDVSGANATFTPDTPFSGIAAIEVRISTGVQDLFGAALPAPLTRVFYTAPETDRWYRMTNLFTGPENPLGLSGTSTCETTGAKVFASDLWQFRRSPFGGPRYILESLSAGDRLGLEGATADDFNPCLMTGFAGIPHVPFTGQRWTLEPAGQQLNPASGEIEHWRRLKTRGFALDNMDLRTEGPFTGQFWQFEPWVGIFVTGAIGDSNGGNAFTLDCGNPNRVVGVDFRSGDDIDNISVRCVTPEGSEFNAGSAGSSSGGSPSVRNCPVGSVFAGFYGRSRTGAWLDQAGIMCRWPFHEPEPWDDLLGINFQNNPIIETTCPTPWRVFGVGGRSGTLIDNLYMRCHPPERTFAETGPVGGSGGNPFSITCPPGQAAAGFRGRAGDDINQLRLGCKNSELVETADSDPVGGNGGQDLGDAQMCFPDEVMVGVLVRTSGHLGTEVIDQLSVRCSTPGFDTFSFGRAETLAGVAQSSNPVQTIDCPAGMYVTAVSGRFGAVLDNIKLHCSTH